MEDVFYPGPFSFRMGLGRGEPGEFFRSRAGDETLIAKRKKILANHPERHCVLLPESEPLLEEFNEQLAEWGAVQSPLSGQELGQTIASDYLLLEPDDNGMPTLLGGCVCFPSSWAFEEKVGRPLDWIHAVVPTLNETLGEKARSFLAQLHPGQAWLRTNWGLTATASLNQHPALNLPRLTAETDPVSVWFRIERQALVAQPKTGGHRSSPQPGPVDGPAVIRDWTGRSTSARAARARARVYAAARRLPQTRRERSRRSGKRGFS